MQMKVTSRAVAPANAIAPQPWNGPLGDGNRSGVTRTLKVCGVAGQDLRARPPLPWDTDFPLACWIETKMLPNWNGLGSVVVHVTVTGTVTRMRSVSVIGAPIATVMPTPPPPPAADAVVGRAAASTNAPTASKRAKVLSMGVSLNDLHPDGSDVGRGA